MPDVKIHIPGFSHEESFYAVAHAALLHPLSRSYGLGRRLSDRHVRLAESDYNVPNITELGPGHQDVHYTHSIDMFIREGGVAPPVWARANGVDSVMFGITFMEEFQGVFVRTDDPAASVADLAGRRLALPVWPRLVFNFWRFAALKGLTSALKVHGVAPDAVRFVDIVEGWDPSERRNVGTQDLDIPARCEYRGQLEALLAG